MREMDEIKGEAERTEEMLKVKINKNVPI